VAEDLGVQPDSTGSDPLPGDASMEQGAAPITPMDGEKLVEKLIEYGIGVRKREVMLWELDPTAFAGTSEIEG